MAATLQPADAFEYAKSFLKRMPLEDIEVPILQEVNQMVWMAAPWRWTQGSLPATTVTSDTQDYTIATPDDFLYLINGYISDGDRVYRQLEMEASLPADVKVVGNPSRISYVGENEYRTFPKSGTLPATPLQQFILQYKRKAPIITNETQYTDGFLEMDDEWFWVYIAGVLWKSYQWGDDGRAGQVTLAANGAPQYTGQLGVFKDALRIMSEREKLPLLEPSNQINPKETKK